MRGMRGEEFSQGLRCVQAAVSTAITVAAIARETLMSRSHVRNSAMAFAGSIWKRMEACLSRLAEAVEALDKVQSSNVYQNKLKTIQKFEGIGMIN